MTKWTAADIPDQSGRTAIVTGANSGLGLCTAAALARAGAQVILACRDTGKGSDAASRMTGDVEVRRLDLADLDSVRRFADTVDAPVDLLVNNAGVMAIPLRRTAQGFEMQVGTNHLGHFALTGLLLDRVTDRVVTLSSVMHRIGAIRLDDLSWERGYHQWPAYGQSKLANLMFAYELQHRLDAAGSTVRSMAAHPGYARTNLQSRTESPLDVVTNVLNRVWAQSATMGALPTLYAATAPDLPGGTYVGPDGLGQQRGHPKPVGSNRRSRDREVQRRLWGLSEELTGVEFDLPSTVSSS
ncbi:oxidoreductase [Rhodococcus sp. X156]|uniref:oxidoreductase n=1 Tax=Rhodococcus sp. X156 TaxID=2499145 RepID=UPI000FD73705|nr:oxidoreductase [Rhodococcus sp. X156]